MTEDLWSESVGMKTWHTSLPMQCNNLSLNWCHHGSGNHLRGSRWHYSRPHLQNCHHHIPVSQSQSARMRKRQKRRRASASRSYLRAHSPPIPTNNCTGIYAGLRATFAKVPRLDTTFRTTTISIHNISIFTGRHFPSQLSPIAAFWLTEGIHHH